MEKRGQLIWQELAPWIIGIGVLVLSLILYMILTDKGTGLIGYLKNLFRFR